MDKLTKKQKRIYQSILDNFPSTDKATAIEIALNERDIQVFYS